MNALPYFLLLLPLVDLAMSNADVGDLMVGFGLVILGWKNRWLR